MFNLFYIRAAVKAISYVEKSSDEEDGVRRRRRNKDSTPDDYDDASDYGADEVVKDDDGDEDDDDSVSDRDSDSIELSSEEEKKLRGHSSGRIERRERTSRSKTNNPRVTKSPTVRVINDNPDNRVRSIAMGPLNDETLYQFHVRCYSRYKELHGDMRVKQAYTVPWCDKWPQEMWGVRLGPLTNNIRGGFRYRDKKDELIAIGFIYDIKDVLWEEIKLAFMTYKKINGDLRVPRTFTVPSGSSEWPECTWDMNLGNKVNKIRNAGNHSQHRTELIKMGFDYSSKTTGPKQK